MIEATNARPAGPAHDAPISQAGKRWALLLLLAVYASNLSDRAILSTVGQAIKQDMKLSDLQLGLLGGLSFALFYTLLGIPIARLAERRSRVAIISAAIAVWSAMTALCGLTQSYVQLLLCRVGVGVGEAGCSPPAHSLIADYYPRDRRASAISIYSLGNPIGVMIGAIAGGWIAQHLGWRYAFIIVGAPGLLLAVAVRLLLREPARGESEPWDAAERDARAGRDAPTLVEVLKRIWHRPALVQVIVGLSLGSFVTYATNQFLHPFLVREFGLSVGKAALIFGLILGLAAAAGAALGGFLSDWAARFDQRWRVWIPAAGLAVSAPLTVLALVQSDWRIASAILVLPTILLNTFVAPSYGCCHNMVEPRMRATAMALMLFCSNLIGGGLGPMTIGFLSDRFARHAFTLGDFAQRCPGGAAPAGSGSALHAACAQASAFGVKYAIIAATAVFLWASVHYLLAARTIRRDLAA